VLSLSKSLSQSLLAASGKKKIPSPEVRGFLLLQKTSLDVYFYFFFFFFVVFFFVVFFLVVFFLAVFFFLAGNLFTSFHSLG
jgi:hypothetical protein